MIQYNSNYKYDLNNVPYRGDQRYQQRNNKFEIDAIRCSFYDVFGTDLNIKKEKEKIITSVNMLCPSYGLEQIFVPTKKEQYEVLTPSDLIYAQIENLYFQKDSIGNANRYTCFRYPISILDTIISQEYLRFIKLSNKEITGENFNFVMKYKEFLEFWHIPFDRSDTGFINDNLRKGISPKDYSNEFILLLSAWTRFGGGSLGYIQYVDYDKLKRLIDEKDLKFITQYMKRCNEEYLKYYLNLVQVEIGPSLSHIKKNKCLSMKDYIGIFL